MDLVLSFIVAVAAGVVCHYIINYLFAYWHYSICNLRIQYADLSFMCYIFKFFINLDFHQFLCYTTTRCKAHKNKVL